MKFTITRINKQNKLMVSSKTIERFLERIAKDDAKLSVTNFRMSVPLMEADYQYYKGIKEWQHVYPAAEFNKDESGNLVFQKSNGLVMLHFINLMSDQEKDAVKKTVSLLPMTFAAFEGADGRSLIVLVSIADEAAAFVLSEFSCRINLLPLFHADIVVIVAFHEWCTHSEIGDTLLGVVLGDAFPKTVDAFLADHQLVLPVDSSDGKLHIQANYMI